MKLQLTKEEKKLVVEAVEDVIHKGDAWEDENLHLPAVAIIDAVLSIKGMKKGPDTDDAREGFVTNGWEWDWWQTFIFAGKSYTLSGSGFYGGHSFHLSDE